MSNILNFNSLRILVIDDDEFMLDVVTIALKRLSTTNVTTCTSGHSALEKIDAGMMFDVAMVDLNMPIMDGVEVLRNLAIRKFSGGILLFSGEDGRILKTAESLASAHNLNVLGALHKPVAFEELQVKLATYHPKDMQNIRTTPDLVCPEELRRAIANREIVPFFQPKVNVTEKRMVSAEVLARWVHPERGIIPPIAFIPVAEEHLLIDELTQVLYEQSVVLLARWIAEGDDFSISVNISADSLSRVGLPEQLARILAGNELDCNHIDLEVTESKLMLNMTTALDVLTRLRLKGFGLSIDDFGTGYSSMSQLSNIPFTELKIDRAFVHGAGTDSAARAILESSAALAKKLNMTIVAEGVEDQNDWDVVTSVGCDLVQGYFIAKPMAADKFEHWFHNHNAICDQIISF